MQKIVSLMNNTNHYFRLFLCGDVMIGRGIDQALPYNCPPQLYESFVHNAKEYLFLAEAANGKILYPVSMDYIWGDALLAWQTLKPDLKIINLETAITLSEDHWPNKEIHYRMHPSNIDVLTVANIQACALGNNHILDWGDAGLKETLNTLKQAHIQYAGAGSTLQEAMRPAIFELNSQKRVLLFSIGSASSGVPSSWAAHSDLSGIYYLSDINDTSLDSIINNIKYYKKNGDLIILSIHWGSNWGYEVPESFRSFAYHLINKAQVDVIFGHSSHHPRGIEIYNKKPIFYGCGDFINDYEGIRGYEEYRGDLSLMYFLDFDKTSLALKRISLVPLQIKNFKLHFANLTDRQWLLETLNRASDPSAQFTEMHLEASGIPIFIAQ